MSPAGKAMPRRSNAGFTLLEMLIVVTILGLVLAALPLRNTSLLGRAELKTLAQTMAAELRDARRLARSQQTRTALLFDVSERRFGESIQIPDDVTVTFNTSVEELVGPSVGQILFYPDGSSNGARITLQRGKEQVSISARWLNGLVDVDDAA